MADMDRQPAQNLSSAEAIEKIKALADKSGMCMFQTNLQNIPSNIRPMALQKVDDDGVFWFISSSESDKNAEIKQDPRVILTFQNDSKYEYLFIHGEAQIHTDKALIDKYWTDFAKAWFDGKDDPRVTIISVTPDSGHYWDTQNGKIISGIKMVFSMLTGSKTDDGGIEGEIKI